MMQKIRPNQWANSIRTTPTIIPTKPTKFPKLSLVSNPNFLSLNCRIDCQGERATALARAFASRSSQVILLFIITESQISASMRSCVQTSGDTPSIEPVL